MAVVTAFKTLASTTDAGLTAYWRATGCTAITIADVIPLLSKITVYADEYVIGEMKIWDSGVESVEPNNCAMARVMVYNDGWIVAWFDEETVKQGGTTGGCAWVDAQKISGFGSVIAYQDQYNGYLLEVESSTPTDPECPDGTVFCIREANFADQTIRVHNDRSNNAYHFNDGYSYTVTIYPSNGNLVWWGDEVGSATTPTNLSNRLYRAIYEMWENLRYSSNATDATDTSITKAFLDDGGVFTDYTSEFNNATANDVPLMPATEEVDDAFYYGSANKFRGLTLNIGTAGVGNTIVWEYWDGSAWSSLTVTDLTSGFTVAGSNTVTFTPQDDWIKTTVNSSEQFWIRSRVSVAAFTTQPLLTQGWVIVSDELTYTDTNLGMYSFEDTSANYCLICGINYYDNIYNGVKSSTQYFYNTSLLAKTIYSHNISYGFANRISGSSPSGSGKGYVYMNGKLLYYYYKQISSSPYYSPGYMIRNVENIDTNIGSQNVFESSSDIYGGHLDTAHVYIPYASVLITS